MAKLTIQEVAKVLIEKNGLAPKEATRFASEFFAVILQHLQDDEQVKVKGLGTFKIISVDARESVSVRTGERVMIDSHSKVTFTPDTLMKELVNKPFSQFETVVLNEGVEFDDMETPAEADPTVIAEEPTVAAEEPAVIAEEPAVAAEEPAVIAEEPTVIAEEPIIELAEDLSSETSDEDEPAETPDEDEPAETPWRKWLLTALGILLLMALACWGGYQYGTRQQVAAADTIVVTDTVYVAEEDSIQEEVTMETEADDETPAAAEEKPAVPETKPAAPDTKPTAPETKPAAPDRYAEKDERVRLGAYRIVGTEKEVTVLPGQTFYSICRAHLGPDMQCYVEVYNDFPRNPQVKEGQVIKIPKLELKRKKR